MHQGSAIRTGGPVGPPRSKDRTALTLAETGWCAAYARTAAGMELVATNTLEGKQSSASTGKEAAVAASALLLVSASKAITQDMASPKSSRSAMAPARA